ncbi:hypothetical protein Dda_6022 [Drechslerella dactyloides]|uniref:Pre-mRNA-processing protein prp40 n=1 Tax=Drechslerella dactyloides TaxID=74499 RepID=A0AAD6IWZ1_DREDA|nr:hypothetical protein Dda_6022 [Drechslerella dactyloides]
MSTLWQEARAPDGKTYYYNSQTKATQWQKPLEMMAPLERAIAGQPWREYTTPEGKKYWSHVETKQSVWDMPDSFRVAVESAQKLPTLPPAPQFVTGGMSNFNNSIYQPSGPHRERERVERDRDDHPPAERPGASLPDNVNPARAAAFANTLGDKNESQYQNYADAEAAFFKLLKKNNIGPDSSWEQALKLVIKESAYRAIKDPKDRKAAFEKYTAELRMQDLEKQKDRMTKLRQDFTTMLKSHPEIKYYTRWRTARKYIEGETIFRSAADDGERRSLFEEYILELRKEEQEREAAEKRQALDDLAGLLKSMNLEPYTRWSEAQGLIRENESFKSESKFQVLSKLDVLNVFESHIKFLERSSNDNRQKQKQMKQRRERKNREAFVALLDELQANGKIRSGCKWKEIHPLIKDDERYDNMLGQSGSTPLDLFWDKVEDIEREVRSKKNIVMDILEERRFQVSPKTNLDEFIHTLRSDSRTAQWSHEDFAAVFDKIHEKSVKRNEEDRHQADRQQRRRIDALRSAIKHLDPPVSVNDTWAQIRPRLLKLEEFKALDSEELRHQIAKNEKVAEEPSGSSEPTRQIANVKEPEHPANTIAEIATVRNESANAKRIATETVMGTAAVTAPPSRMRTKQSADVQPANARDNISNLALHSQEAEATVSGSANEVNAKGVNANEANAKEVNVSVNASETETEIETVNVNVNANANVTGIVTEIGTGNDSSENVSVMCTGNGIEKRGSARERLGILRMARDREDFGNGIPRRRTRPLSPGEESDIARREAKRSRHERGSFERLPLDGRPPTRDEHYDKPTPKELGKAVNLNYGDDPTEPAAAPAPARTSAAAPAAAGGGDNSSEEGEIAE